MWKNTFQVEEEREQCLEAQKFIMCAGCYSLSLNLSPIPDPSINLPYIPF